MSDDLDAWELTGVLTRLRRVMRASVRGEFPWEALPMAQVEILQRLSEEPGRRVGELAAQHRLAMNTVSNLVQQMVVSGLVERRTDETDRRAVTVHLTDEGRARLRAWLAAHERRLSAAMAELSTDDRRIIVAATGALGRLAERMESDES